MQSLHALVGMPKHGLGAHPDNLVMALDGRGKNKIAPKGELDSTEHQGSLFWVVGKHSTKTIRPRFAPTGKYLPEGETVELFRSSLSKIQEEKMLNKFKSYL